VEDFDVGERSLLEKEKVKDAAKRPDLQGETKL
jgi:hypothetical protein